MQPAAKKFNYKKGDFPIAEKLCASTISLPVHEYVKKEAIYNISNLINKFFKYNKTNEKCNLSQTVANCRKINGMVWWGRTGTEPGGAS